MSARIEVTREALEGKIRAGEIDTVLMVFPDLQGRLVGKRTTGRFFLQQVADDGTENCDYLIACDMDNNPVPGYREYIEAPLLAPLVAGVTYQVSFRVNLADVSGWESRCAYEREVDGVGAFISRKELGFISADDNFDSHATAIRKKV